MTTLQIIIKNLNIKNYIIIVNIKKIDIILFSFFLF